MSRRPVRIDVDALVAAAYAAHDPDDVDHWIERLGQAIAAVSDDHARARLLLTRAAIVPFDRPASVPLADAQEAAALFDAAGDMTWLARASALAASLTAALDDARAALDHVVRSLVAVEQVPDPDVASDVLNELAVVFHQLTVYDRALELYERSGAAARRSGSRWRVERSEHNIVESLLASVRLARLVGEPLDVEGRLIRAEGLARELASAADTDDYLTEGPRLLADVLCEVGRPEEAWLTLIGSPAPGADGFQLASRLAVQARCLLLLGQPTRALAGLDEAIAAGAGSGDEADALLLLHERSKAREECGDLAGALADARTVAALVWSRQLRQTQLLVDRVGAMAEAEMGRRHVSRSAETDALTDVGNRLALDRRLDRSGDRPCVAVIVVDVDHFAEVNDGHGRAVGDEALAAVAAQLRLDVRDGDLVARTGGDEFVLVLDGLDLAAAEAIAERVRSRIAGHTWPAWGDGLALTVSVGAAAGAGRDARQLLHRADLSLYEAKRSGRDRVVATG